MNCGGEPISCPLFHESIIGRLILRHLVLFFRKFNGETNWRGNFDDCALPTKEVDCRTPNKSYSHEARRLQLKLIKIFCSAQSPDTSPTLILVQYSHRSQAASSGRIQLCFGFSEMTSTGPEPRHHRFALLHCRQKGRNDSWAKPLLRWLCRLQSCFGYST